MAGKYLQLVRSKETEELMKNPSCFLLLTQIAYRAKREDDFNIHNLEIGEALIGDYKNIGLSEQKYRTAKEKLEKWNFATFKATNKGTIAKLINTRVFDINTQTSNGQNNIQITSQQRTNNDQITTNKNLRIKELKNNISHLTFEEFWQLYPKKQDKKKAEDKYNKALSKGIEHSQIIQGLQNYITEIKNANTAKQYIKHPTTWLNGECWNDVYTQNENSSRSSSLF